MSRRPATFTQADLHRALKAAQQAGTDWRVEVEGGVIRMTREKTTTPPPVIVEPVAEQQEAEAKWRF
jgi:hypothetical protein